MDCVLLFVDLHQEQDAFLYLKYGKKLNPEGSPYPRRISTANMIDYAVQVGCRVPEFEEHIIKLPRNAYVYARKVIKERWPEAEETIKDNFIVYRQYRDRFGISDEEA